MRGRIIFGHRKIVGGRARQKIRDSFPAALTFRQGWMSQLPGDCEFGWVQSAGGRRVSPYRAVGEQKPLPRRARRHTKEAPAHQFLRDTSCPWWFVILLPMPKGRRQLHPCQGSLPSGHLSATPFRDGSVFGGTFGPSVRIS